MNEQKTNPLGTEKISNLLLRFAIPSIIAMVVSALYNMVDQFFIGRSVGMLGNAATNVAFPLVITCTAIALMCGIGGAANFNLCMGQQEKRRLLPSLEMQSQCFFTWYDPLYHNKIIFKTNDDLIWRNI